MHLENQHLLKNLLQKMVEEMSWEEKLAETTIRQTWSAKMGTTINQYTREINLRKGKLFIQIQSAPLKQELSYQRDKIRDMMNAKLGAKVVEEVIVM
jgi:predicted nucleic acid-binding Zn ribbon protein